MRSLNARISIRSSVLLARGFQLLLVLSSGKRRRKTNQIDTKTSLLKRRAALIDVAALRFFITLNCHLIKNPVCCRLNHVVDALSGTGRVEDDAHIGRNAVLVVASIDGNGATGAEAIGPPIG